MKILALFFKKKKDTINTVSFANPHLINILKINRKKKIVKSDKK